MEDKNAAVASSVKGTPVAKMEKTTTPAPAPVVVDPTKELKKDLADVRRQLREQTAALIASEAKASGYFNKAMASEQEMLDLRNAIGAQLDMLVDMAGMQRKSLGVAFAALTPVKKRTGGQE